MEDEHRLNPEGEEPKVVEEDDEGEEDSEEEDDDEAEDVEEGDDESDDDYSTDELAEHADDKVDVLINLLVKKGIISEEEFEKAYDDFYEDEGEE